MFFFVVTPTEIEKDEADDWYGTIKVITRASEQKTKALSEKVETLKEMLNKKLDSQQKQDSAQTQQLKTHIAKSIDQLQS